MSLGRGLRPPQGAARDDRDLDPCISNLSDTGAIEGATAVSSVGHRESTRTPLAATPVVRLVAVSLSGSTPLARISV